MHFGFALELSNVDLLNIDLLDTDIRSKYHLQDMSSRRVQDMYSRRLQDMFSRRLQRNNFLSSKTSSRPTNVCWDSCLVV